MFLGGIIVVFGAPFDGPPGRGVLGPFELPFDGGLEGVPTVDSEADDMVEDYSDACGLSTCS